MLKKYPEHFKMCVLPSFLGSLVECDSVFALVYVDDGFLRWSPTSQSAWTTRLRGECLSFTAFLTGQLEEKMLTAVRIFYNTLVTNVFFKWTFKLKSCLELQLIWISSIFDSFSTSLHIWGIESKKN